jgi:dienelactone hydrolase
MAFAAAGTAAAAEQVDIPLADMVLRGRLFQPEGAGPFPSVVALHECESLTQLRGFDV